MVVMDACRVGDPSPANQSRVMRRASAADQSGAGPGVWTGATERCGASSVLFSGDVGSVSVMTDAVIVSGD